MEASLRGTSSAWKSGPVGHSGALFKVFVTRVVCVPIKRSWVRRTRDSANHGGLRWTPTSHMALQLWLPLCAIAFRRAAAEHHSPLDCVGPAEGKAETQQKVTMNGLVEREPCARVHILDID